MKKVVLSTLGCLLAVSAYSQDKLYTHKGDILSVYIKEVNENSIRFSYPNEQSINVLSKNATEKVEYESGRTEKIGEKIIINGEEDWQKVKIIILESDIEGLNKGEEIMAKSSSGWSTTNQGKTQKRAMDKLKKIAASKGYHIVLLITTTGKGGHYGISGGTKSSVTGIGYKY